MTRTHTVAVAALIAAAMLSQASTSASAKAYCVYSAEDISGNRVAAAGTHRKKMSAACNRARRQCNRQLKRKRSRGEFGRSKGASTSCVRIAAEHK
ncbi:MAG: hypothetical protein AAFV26_09210 [Pseudomonadota bacterium]